MYLRHTTVKKDGKVHRYWRLVRSVRRGSKVVQEVVAQLGELDDEGRASARQLARSMTARDDDQRDFFEEDPKEEQRVEVRLDRLRVEHGRVFGNVWLGWRLWCALELDKCCERLMPRGREFVAWASMAALHVIARLCEPSSDLHIAEDWYRKTALEDILGAREEWVNDDRVYRALDALLPHKEKIEQHLKTRLGDLFKLDYDLLLYDVTSTYFEGEMATNPQAQRGYSRDNRSDCKQLCIALVVTKEGVPLGYEIFDGNRTDITTVEEIVSTMERRFGKSDRVWVMDRGMGSEDNLAWFVQTKRRYLVGTPKAELKKWERELLEEKDWQRVREGLEVKLCAGPGGKETFILCRSADRQKKEQAMHDKFVAHRGRASKPAQPTRQAKKAGGPWEGRTAARSAAPAEYASRRQHHGGGEGGHDARVRSVGVVVDESAVAGMGETHRGLLHPANQYRRLDARTTVAHVYPADAGGGCVSRREVGAVDPPDLASHARPRARAHHGLLPGSCAVEDAGVVAGTRRPRQQSTNRARRARTDTDGGRHRADDARPRTRAPAPLRRASRPRTTAAT